MSSSWPVFPWEVQTRPARRVAVLRRHLRAEPQSMGTAESAEGGEAGFPPAAAGPGGPESGLGERGRLGGKTTVSLGAPPPKKNVHFSCGGPSGERRKRRILVFASRDRDSQGGPSTETPVTDNRQRHRTCCKCTSGTQSPIPASAGNLWGDLSQLRKRTGTRTVQKHNRKFKE